MKNILALLLCFATTVTINAQSSIKGKVVDEKQKPVKGASVLLLQQKDSSLVLSALTAENGAYTFDNIKNGNYRVMVNMLGFKKANNKITVAGSAIEIPDTKLVPD